MKNNFKEMDNYWSNLLGDCIIFKKEIVKSF